MTTDVERRPEGVPGRSDENAGAEGVSGVVAGKPGEGEPAEEGIEQRNDLAVEVDRLKEELEKERQKAAENWDLFLRARADLDNFRKRAEREIAQRVRMEKSELLLGILEVADNFDRALAQANAGDSGSVLEGLKLIRRQLETVLGDEGVTAFEVINAPFDPAFHEAVLVEESPEVDREMVAEEIRKGYMYKGEVLRPARVKVRKPAGGARGV